MVPGKRRRDDARKTPVKARPALPPAMEAAVAGFVQAADQLGLAATLSSLKDPAGFRAELGQLAATRARSPGGDRRARERRRSHDDPRGQ